jgi:hypothetical protein
MARNRNRPTGFSVSIPYRMKKTFHLRVDTERQADRKDLSIWNLLYGDCNRMSDSCKKILVFYIILLIALKLRHIRWTSTINIGVENNGKILPYILLLVNLLSIFGRERGVVAVLVSLHLNKHTSLTWKISLCWQYKDWDNCQCVQHNWCWTDWPFFDPSILISKPRFLYYLFPTT